LQPKLKWEAWFIIKSYSNKIKLYLDIEYWSH
jgi:hypothetical protein